MHKCSTYISSSFSLLSVWPSETRLPLWTNTGDTQVAAFRGEVTTSARGEMKKQSHSYHQSWISTISWKSLPTAWTLNRNREEP